MVHERVDIIVVKEWPTFSNNVEFMKYIEQLFVTLIAKKLCFISLITQNNEYSFKYKIMSHCLCKLCNGTTVSVTRKSYTCINENII